MLRSGTFVAIATVAAVTVPAVARPPASLGQDVATDPGIELGTRIEDGALRGADLHIVAFGEKHAVPGDAFAAIERSGGQVVDVVEPLGVALVASDQEGFLDEVMTASTAITGAARNHPIGTADAPSSTGPAGIPEISDAWAQELLSEAERQLVRDNAATAPGEGQGEGDSAARSANAAESNPDQAVATGEPLSARQWGMQMIGATPETAHRVATGQGVTVGIIDTGIDGSHPDVAPNLDRQRSRDFVLPGATADRDPAGHGTHVAGVVAAASNDLGISGVAPNATLVNLRAGQESGHFFVYEVVSSLVAAGDLGLDVVSMSFYTDPWLYNCASRADYISGSVTDEQIAEQGMIRQVMLDALKYAHDRGVTLVAAGGNEHLDMSAPERFDTTSPSSSPEAGRARARTVTNNCLDLPAEGPNVVTVSSVGPSGTKADYANYGLGSIDLVAPGGWLGDRPGTPQSHQAGNLILSAFPQEAAQHLQLADQFGQPTDVFSLRDCRGSSCGFYTYLQGTSMAAPFVAGVAALIIQRHGRIGPEQVAAILTGTATDQPCPPGGVADYSTAGRPSSWKATCVGTPAENSLHGHGVVNAMGAVR